MGGSVVEGGATDGTAGAAVYEGDGPRRGGDGVTVAVRVTGWPMDAGIGEDRQDGGGIDFAGVTVSGDRRRGAGGEGTVCRCRRR